MRRNRIIYYILLILSIVSISFYGGAISFGFFFCMLLIPIISAIYLALVYGTFRIYQKIDTRQVVAKNIVPYYLTIQNAGIVPFVSFKISFYSSFSTVYGVEETQYEFAPLSGMKISTELICKYRGEYEVGVKDIEICDFFRLFKIKFKNREPLRVIVNPSFVYYDNLEENEEALFSSRESSASKNIPDVLTREYVAGDDYRYIHWKNTATMGKLMIRNLTGEEKNGIGIVFNAKRYSQDNQDYIPLEDRMLEKVLSLSMYFLSKKSNVNVYTVSGDIRQTGLDNIDDFDRLYESLSQVIFSMDDEEDSLLVKLLNLPTLLDNRMIFIITHEKSNNVIQLTDYFNDNNVGATVIEVP